MTFVLVLVSLLSLTTHLVREFIVALLCSGLSAVTTAPLEWFADALLQNLPTPSFCEEHVLCEQITVQKMTWIRPMP